MRKKAERGQITVLLGVTLSTFILFFMFVVNIGMLVHAKINLQNAADLAAYSGAASQARLLNQIGLLNYEMRQHFKKLLFRYHVVANMSQKSHAASLSDTGERVWSPDGRPENDYGVPAICITFNSQDNFCQMDSSPALEEMPNLVVDGISTALNAQIRALEAIRVQRCRAIGLTNQIVASLWLFNTDPEVTNLAGEMEGPDSEVAGNVRLARAISTGLGLVPRLQLLFQRIKTLEYYLNFPPQTGLTPSLANALFEEGDLAARERPIQAFFSAFNTLGPHTFSTPEGEAEHITMDELLPVGGAEGLANVVRLLPINTDFEVYYMRPTPPSEVEDSGPCTSVPLPMKARGVTVGVHKDPQTLTYYALRLKAKARLLFSPFGRVTLKAYAAAMPFGSRIGPPLNESEFRRDGATPSLNNANFLCQDCFGTPNLPILREETSREGWWMSPIISTYFQFMREPLTPGVSLTSREMERAYHAAMVPNPWEKGKYIIAHDLGAVESDEFNQTVGNPFVRFFDDQQTHAFWAPLASSDRNTDVSAEIKVAMEAALGDSNQLANPEVLDAFSQSIDSYISRLRSQSGEDGETFNVIRIRNPLMSAPATGDGFETVSVGAGAMMREQEDFKTHWNDINDGDLERRGRIGYSVKIVSIRALIDKTIQANGQEEFSNSLPTGLDSESEADLQFIKH